MYAGKNGNDEVGRTSETDYPITFRRFTIQNRDLDNWVSTCEGTWSPWVGPNNNSNEVEKGKDVLFTKIINHESSRTTIEIGEPGDGFFTLRVDDIKASEKMVGSEASPAIIGNRFKLQVSDKGAVDIRAAGKGITGANFNGTHISINENGDLVIHSKGKIALSHGDTDEAVNSIVLDPQKGIDLTALNGVRINGKEVVLKPFLDWLQKYQAAIAQPSSLGVPAPINPLAIPELTLGLLSPAKFGGFQSTGVGPPAAGIIADQDLFKTV
jgi:hypothetical protein